MSTVQCPKCSAAVPAAARFCPRCGHEMGAPVPAPRDETWPSRSRMPIAGLLFLVAAVLGPVVVIAGIITGNPVFIIGGIAFCVVLVLLLLLGMVF